MIRKKIDLSNFLSMEGESFGHTDWLLIEQGDVDQFAKVTKDEQFLHVDKNAAIEAGFGGTIVHGFFTLSLLSKFQFDLLPEINGVTSVLNYGLDKVRFIAPVPTGSRVRGQLEVINVTERSPNQYLVKMQTLLEIEGSEKPGYIAEHLSLFLTS